MRSQPLRPRNVIAVGLCFCAIPFALAFVAACVLAGICYGFLLILMQGAILLHTDSTREDKAWPWQG